MLRDSCACIGHEFHHSFDEQLGIDPPPVASVDRLWMRPLQEAQPESAPVLNAPGKSVVIDYRVRRGPGEFFGDIVALSDGPGNGGSVSFVVGDRTVNAAVDELVRTLPPKTQRRAIVPALFDLDRGTRATYPREEPPGVTYLEVNLRRLSASNAVGVCQGSDAADDAYAVASCICNKGRSEKYGIFE